MKKSLPQPYHAVVGGHKQRANRRAFMLALGVIAVVAIAGAAIAVAMHHSAQKPAPVATNTTVAPQHINQPKPGAVQISNSVVVTQTYAQLGQFLGDPAGRALYTYDKDTSGVSNCTGSCLQTWPIYQAASSSNLPQDITVVSRTDGTLQYAYKGHPLYYFTSDSDGQVTGDGLAGFHVAKP